MWCELGTGWHVAGLTTGLGLGSTRLFSSDWFRNARGKATTRTTTLARHPPSTTTTLEDARGVETRARRRNCECEVRAGVYLRPTRLGCSNTTRNVRLRLRGRLWLKEDASAANPRSGQARGVESIAREWRHRGCGRHANAWRREGHLDEEVRCAHSKSFRDKAIDDASTESMRVPLTD
jgi:hypothetical protein